MSRLSFARPHAFPRFYALDAVYGLGTENAVPHQRFIVVGAVSVGDELKTFAAVFFGHIKLVDLDVVIFTNLNCKVLC